MGTGAKSLSKIFSLLLYLPAKAARRGSSRPIPPTASPHWTGARRIADSRRTSCRAASLQVSQERQLFARKMTNMFGVVPGTKYGWPKNVLHWKGIHRSILDICATAPAHFVIADGVVAMEGNGPLNGSHRHLGKIVLADDPVAADFTCARLMGLNPHAVWHLDRAAHFLGNGSHDRIDMIAEGLPRNTVPFDVLPEFASLQTRV